MFERVTFGPTSPGQLQPVYCCVGENVVHEIQYRSHPWIAKPGRYIGRDSGFVICELRGLIHRLHRFHWFHGLHRLHSSDLFIRFFKREFFRILQIGLAARFDLMTVNTDKLNALLPSRRRTRFSRFRKSSGGFDHSPVVKLVL